MKAFIFMVCLAFAAVSAEAKLKALIVDGQGWHQAWPQTTIMMKQYLEETGLFEVDIARSAFTWKGEKRDGAWLPLAGVGPTEDLPKSKTDPNFAPDFGAYDVVINNFGNDSADWPESTQRAFETYMKNGGGLVVTHGANNAFGTWVEYNKMIGLGGWGGRNQDAGPYVYYTNDGERVRDTEDKGPCGQHGSEHNIPITLRVKDHPITQGLPEQWLTARDECYARLRGPAENMTILATGKDQTKKAPTDRHEPLLMVVSYGEGRVFNLALGHDNYSREGVGFITTFTRGAEWAATGQVTQPVPADFPTVEKTSSRKFVLKNNP
jgi:type 1 glutamine amidotransferase